MARMREKRGTYMFLVRKPERDHLENLDVDVKIILKLIIKKSVGRKWIGLIWLTMGTSGGQV